MSLIEFDVWTAPYDLSAAPDARLSTDDSLTDAGFNPVLYGEGDGFLEIHIDDPDTQYLQRRAFVRAVRTDTEEPIFDFILEEADTKILAKDSADKVIRWSGRGALYLLDRYRLGQAVYAPDQPNRGSVSIIDYWTWLNISPGGILRRVWEEGFHHPDAFYANTSVDFTRVTDSQDETWVDVTDYQTRIGTSGLQVVADMMRMGLMVRARPVPDSVQFQAFKDLSFRTDRTSATFTDGKVRFEGGVNVAVELPQKIAALRERTHTLTRRKDGQYATETLNGSGEPYMDFREVPFTSDPDAVEAFVGAHHLNLQKQSLVAVVQHRIGPVVLGIGSEFGYFPSINGDYWPGDLVTVHTGTGEYDLNEQALEVAGIRYFLRGADWMMECQLGAQSISANGLPALPAAGPSTVVTPQLQLCQADVESTVTDVPLIDWDWESGDESTPEWTTINQPAGEGVVVDNFDAFVGEYYGFFDNTGANSTMPPGPTNAALVPVTPGDTIEITWRSRKGSTGFACLGIAWLTDDFTDWDATGRASFIDSEEIVKTWTQGSAFQNHTEQVTVPAGVTAMYLNSNGGGTTSTWYLHDLLVTLLGVTSGESFDGDGPEELVGTGTRAARCDHNHYAENLLTEETDDTLVLKPDGAGGVEWGEGGGGGGGSVNAVRVTRTGALNITTSAAAVSWDNEVRDDGGFWASSPNPTRLTAPATGWYQVGGGLVTSNDDDDWLQMFLRVDGSTYIAQTEVVFVANATPKLNTISTLVYLTSGQYVELWAVAAGTMALSVGDSCSMWMMQVGGTDATSSGTAFPGSPSTDDLFYHETYGELFQYDGTRWLGQQRESYLQSIAVTGVAADATVAYFPVHPTDAMWLDELVASMFVSGTNNGSNFWEIELLWVDSANTATSLLNVSTAADAGSTWLRKSGALGSVVDANARVLRLGADENGSAGNLFYGASLRWRRIGT